MAIKHHSFKAVCFAILSGLYLFAGITVVSAAESGALEQLLELFEKKGAITREEAGKIRLTIQQDRKQLEEKETAIQEQERALLKREKELAGKEKALQIKEQALLHEQTPPKPEKQTEKIVETALKSAPPESTSTKKDKKGSGSYLEAKFDNGFCLTSPEENKYSLCIGGLLQADYRYFENS